MEFRFCPFCGYRLQTIFKNKKKRLFCNKCKKIHYKNPTVGVAVILTDNSRLLLVKRLGSYEGMWCIPCGHVEWEEDVREAAEREFKEETGLEVITGPVFAVHSNFHDQKKQTTGIWFLGKYKGGKLKAGSDACEADFFPVDDLPEPMAFPTDILVCDQLKGCLEKGSLSERLDFAIPLDAGEKNPSL